MSGGHESLASRRTNQRSRAVVARSGDVFQNPANLFRAASPDNLARRSTNQRSRTAVARSGKHLENPANFGLPSRIGAEFGLVHLRTIWPEKIEDSGAELATTVRFSPTG
jgi:hypothetical protein